MLNMSGLPENKTLKVMQFLHYVGIDVSKDTLDAAIYPCADTHEDCFHFENSAAGMRSFTKWLKGRKVNPKKTLFCAEFTGVYANSLIDFAAKKELFLGMIPSLEIKRSLGIARGKNDRIDSLRIAEYAYRHRDEISLYEKPSSTLTLLQTLLRERRQYVKQSHALRIMLKELDGFSKGPSHKRAVKNIDQIKDYIKEIDEQILSVISSDPKLKANYDLVTSIPGVGMINAVNTIIYTRNFESFTDPRKYACYVGVAPFEHTSGTSVRGRTRVSKLGNQELKRDLTLAARASIKFDPWMKNYFQRKSKEKGGGKDAYGLVLNAVKFKVILRMFSVVKSGEPYKVLCY